MRPHNLFRLAISATSFALAFCLTTGHLAWAEEEKPASNKQTWALIEIKGEYPEATDAPGIFGEVVESLGKLQQRLNKAAKDDALSGVLLSIKNPQLGWGKINEIRQSIEAIKTAGKTVVAYVDSPMTGDYLIASACSKIVMPESGTLMTLGLRSEISFYKNMLGFLDIEPEILRIGEFKSAGEPYSRSEMSPEFRLEMEAILDDLYSQISTTIAAARGKSREAVEKVIDTGPHSAAKALAEGLIDHVAYESDLAKLFVPSGQPSDMKLVRNYGKRKLDTDFSGLNGFINMMNLIAGVEPAGRKNTNPKIAVIHATGAIMPGESSSGMLSGDTMGSDTIIKAIRQVRDDNSIKAVVLRVDSPGGSALASDLIWHELETLNKPVIASMGNVAASGGYYISMGADVIYAEPGTITGSIGVVGGKLALDKFYKKIGINTTILKRGANSGVLSSTTGFSDSERTAMMTLLKDIYEQFTKKAAAGRGMEVDTLEKLARGRVYTGAMAKELKLVDKLGTLGDAIAEAKAKAGFGPDDKLERLNLPKAVNPLEQLLGVNLETRAAATTTDFAVALAGDAGAPTLKELGRHLWLLRLLEQQSTLLVMPFSLKIE
jgi:protease IV